MSDDPHQDTESAWVVRHARLRLETAVLMSRGDESFATEMEDISATGVLLRRPRDWMGAIKDVWVLDLIFGGNLHIHLEAEIARTDDDWIGMAYSRIPEDKQTQLWDILGRYADELDPRGPTPDN